MKNKITKKSFKNFVKEILVDDKVQNLSEKDISEFKIGKNYFYSIKNNKNLLLIQRVINRVFQNEIPINNSATAFRKNYSYLHLFEPHRKNYHFLRLDIRSFFHSIQVNDIKKILEEYFENEYIDDENNQTLIEAFINIITYKIPEDSSNEKFRTKQVLPMGFITSPVISNIIFRKLDIQIQKFCSERNIIYTRYADDMLFSSNKTTNYIHNNHFINEISIIIDQMKFKLNIHKTIQSKHTLSIHGYTLQYSNFEKNFIDNDNEQEQIINELRLSNKKINIIKKIIFLSKDRKESPKIILKKLFKYKVPSTIPINGIENIYIHQFINKLTGYRSYLLSIVIFHNKYNCCTENTIRKYLTLVEELNTLIKNLS